MGWRGLEAQSEVYAQDPGLTGQACLDFQGPLEFEMDAQASGLESGVKGVDQNASVRGLQVEEAHTGDPV